MYSVGQGLMAEFYCIPYGACDMISGVTVRQWGSARKLSFHSSLGQYTKMDANKLGTRKYCC